MQNNQITFKISYLHRGTDPRSIELKTSTRNGRVLFLDIYGALFERQPGLGETVKTFLLDYVEPTVINGEKTTRVCTKVSYIPEEFRKGMPKEESAEHAVNEAAHKFLKSHQSMVVKDPKTGTNLNTNLGSLPLFELIEESALIRAENEKNNLVTEGMSIAKRMFTESPEEFVSLCYAYGITPIVGVPIEVLYNEVVFRIKTNPDHFFAVKNHRDLGLLSMIKKGMQVNSVNEHTAVLYPKNDVYYMDDEMVGATDDEIVEFFNKHPRKLQVLERKLGITPEEVVPAGVTNVAPVSKEEPTILEQVAVTKHDALRENQMKLAISNKITHCIKQIAKDRTNAPAFKSAMLDSLSALQKDKYSDMKDAFDAYMKKKMDEVLL